MVRRRLFQVGRRSVPETGPRGQEHAYSPVMTPTRQARKASRVSATDAAKLVRSGDWLDFGATLAQPDLFDRALAERTSELHDVNIRDA